MKILIIEDSGLARKQLRSLCRQFYPDATYVPATDGLEGLRAYTEALRSEEPFDLMFVDQLMPNMDGLEAGREILRLNPTAYLVMVTANIQTATRDEALRIGFQQFVNKPLSKESIETVFQTWKQDQSGSSETE